MGKGNIHILIEECKSGLEEIKKLIRQVEKLPPDILAERLRKLSLEDKAVVLEFMKLGELALQHEKIKGRKPSYIG